MRGLFLYLFLSPILGFAQAHVRLFDEPTRMWTSEFSGAPDQQCVDHWATTHWLAGDTVINDTTYQRVASHTLYYESYAWGGMNECEAYMHYPDATIYVRENDSLVFVRTMEGERLLYDFSVLIGDSIPYPADYPWPYISLGLPASDSSAAVIAIDSVEVNGTYRKRFIVEPQDWTGLDQYVIEGIGGESGPFNPLVQMTDISFGLASVCVAEHGEVIYSGPLSNCSFITSTPEQHTEPTLHITPNPSDGLIRIIGLAPSQRYVVLDAAGRALVTGSSSELDMRPYPDGLYLLRVVGTEGNVVDAQRLLIQR